jgi:hypothetical protein
LNNAVLRLAKHDEGDEDEEIADCEGSDQSRIRKE